MDVDEDEQPYEYIGKNITRVATYVKKATRSKIWTEQTEEGDQTNYYMT